MTLLPILLHHFYICIYIISIDKLLQPSCTVVQRYELFHITYNKNVPYPISIPLTTQLYSSINVCTDGQFTLRASRQLNQCYRLLIRSSHSPLSIPQRAVSVSVHGLQIVVTSWIYSIDLLHCGRTYFCFLHSI